MGSYVDVSTVELLTGEYKRRIHEQIADGVYRAHKVPGSRGGSSGESYQVEVGSLPVQAQIMYLLMQGSIIDPAGIRADLTAYQLRYGADGMQELLSKQRAAQQGLAARQLNPTSLVEQLTELSGDFGITLRTLYRWMDSYEERGLAGLMRAVKRKDAGTARSMCQAARLHAYKLYANPVKRTQATVYRKLMEKAAELGPDCCQECFFNEGTQARAELLRTGEINQYAPCDDPDKRGMRLPECRQTLSRIVATFPDDEMTMARHGRKAFKDKHMYMATREKPLLANQVWFGDHHQFDCFVLDTQGKPIRPWLTAWYDAASGCLVGWLLCINPNSQTIMEAFTEAVTYKKNVPFYGLPGTLYIDNGKDYRSKVFETGLYVDRDLGKLNENIGSESLIQAFSINVTHAQAYHAWAKSVERFFGTVEDIWIREVPGWCGGSPKERPEDFSKQLRQQLERGQLWTMDQLHEYLRDTVFPEYHNRPHEGHGGKSPLEVYSSLDKVRSDVPTYEMLRVSNDDMVERVVQQIGIRFKNEIYWADELIGMAGKSVVLRFSPDNLSTVSVISGGKYLCEAAVKEKLQLIGEDPGRLGAHMEKQRRQIRDTAERIRQASRNNFGEVLDTDRRGNITSMEYAKAAKGRKLKRSEAPSQIEKEAGAVVRDYFRRRGERVLEEAK